MSQYPSNPRLLPDGSGVVCDQCGQSWSPARGERPDCVPCATALTATVAPNAAAQGWIRDEADGYVFRARPSRGRYALWYGEAKRSSQPFVSDTGGVDEPFHHDLWFEFGDSAEAVIRALKAEVLN